MRIPNEDFGTLIQMYEVLRVKSVRHNAVIEQAFDNLCKALEIFHGQKFENYLLTATKPEPKYISKTKQRKFLQFKAIILKHKVKHWNRMSEKRQVIFDALELADNVTHYSPLTNPMYECLELPEQREWNGVYYAFIYNTEDWRKR